MGPKTKTEILSEIEEKAAKTPALGAIVWWSLDGVEVLMSDAEKAVTNVGLDPKDICPRIETRGAVAKALDSLGFRVGTSGVKKRGKKGKKEEEAEGFEEEQASLRKLAGMAAKAPAKKPEERSMFYRRLRDDETSIAFNVLEEVKVKNPDGSVTATYPEIQQIIYDRKAKALSFTTNFMEDEIREGFKKFGLTYRGNEVRICIMRMLDAAQAIIVRETGGVYFVPRTSFDVLQKLQDFCNAVHPNARLTKLSILETETERKDMQQFAFAAIRKEMDDMAKDIETLQAKAAAGETSIRDSTLERRLEDYKRLREKARCYKDLLAIQTTDVEKGLKVLSTKIEKMLAGNDEAA